MTAQNGIFKVLTEKINDIPAIDVHTHLDTSHLSARGLHDIMLYHMVISDLYCAGCPSGARLSNEPDEQEKTSRIEEAIAYLEHIQNTSCFWLMRIILSDLYNWDEPITLENWHKLDERICNKSSEKSRPREILSRANVIKVSTELPLRGNGSYDDIMFYALEWAFFMRNQWGVFDAPLYELEYAWQFDKPVRPLPVTISKRNNVKRQIKTVSHVKEAMAHYCKAIPFDEVVATAQHVSTDINYMVVSDEDMQKAIDNRQNARSYERDVYASYLFEAFLQELEKSNPGFVLQFSLGAQALPFETDSRLNQAAIKHLGEIISRYPKVRFQCFLASKHANQAMCTLCRELPNLSLAAYWWHNFFPYSIAQIIDERLDMLPTNKQIGFFSDAYCVDWLYAKSKLVRAELAKALTRRIKRGQYTVDTAIETAYKLLKETPEQIYLP
ncbi:MAG: hypothetical protein ABIG61_17125 [Planctomycetota bacterium]